MPRRLATFLITTALLLAGALSALPLVWMIVRSLQGDGRGLEGAEFTIAHYARVLWELPLLRWMANSLLLASGQTLIACITATMAGYVLAHHRFRYRRALLLLLFLTLLLPGQVTMPASWRLIHELGLMNSYFALLLPAGANVFGVLLFMYASAQIPREMLDAARMDGCSELRIWWDVVLPMIQPSLTTFAVLSFIVNWNAYLWPLIVLQDDMKYTMAMGLANLSAMPHQRELGMLLAATTLGVLPSLLLFLAARKSLQEAIADGADR